jgi:holo-[acyl-carrier protein] synthase
MIYGVGTDILDISRIDKILEKYNKKFISRIYGAEEIKIFDGSFSKSSANLFLGKRFAAKEAFWKALSPIRGEGIFFKEVETLNDINGKPYLNLTGNTASYITDKEKKLNVRFKFDISLSDEPPYVIAFVVISLDQNV